MKFQLRRREGFTLIELLIVIVIIGILAVGFAPTLLNAPKKARDAVNKGQLNVAKQAIELYAINSTTGYPATLTAAGASFPGGTVPVAVSSVVKYVAPANLTTDKCYWLYVAVEDPSSGNIVAAPTTATACDSPAAGSVANAKFFYEGAPIN